MQDLDNFLNTTVSFLLGVLLTIIIFTFVINNPNRQPQISTMEIKIKNGVNDTTYLYTF